jgi:hypothetical protein
VQPQIQQEAETPNQFPYSPTTPKDLKPLQTTLLPDVSQVDEDEIRNWDPSQVAHWMYIAGYDGYVIERFMANDINGSILLNLQIDDLKELDIHSFGMRLQLMKSIDHLRSTMMKSPVADAKAGRSSPDQRSCQMSVSPTGEILTRQGHNEGNGMVAPAESVSIVGIEQVLPKPHSCSKGENCSKYQRRQRQIEKIAADNPGAELVPGGAVITGNPGNPDTAKNMLRPTSDAEPSVVASSDVLGPSQTHSKLCEESLKEVEKLDPQESLRHFLNYQHLDGPKTAPAHIATNVPQEDPEPALSPPNNQPTNRDQNLRNLPKLMIPADPDTDDQAGTGTATATAQRTITPTMADQMYGPQTAVQGYGPFSMAGNDASDSDDYYRQGTPFSEMDAPVTAVPSGPVARDTSQSVPPDMRYGNLYAQQQSTRRRPSNRLRADPPLRPVNEGRPLGPIERPADLFTSPRVPQTSSSTNSSLASDPDVTRSGYMKKRKTTRLLRHEWQNAHFTLRGTNLAMHKDESEAHRASRALDNVDVDDYAVACSSAASSSKLSAAFKRSILRNDQNLTKDQAAFAFSLVPFNKENEKKALFGHNNNNKSHHFAVKNRDERIDWMRELMLAKALKKGKDGGSEMQVNGNFI